MASISTLRDRQHIRETPDGPAKRLELLRELAPKATVIAMLVNPISPDAAPEIRDVQATAQAIGLQLKMFNASTRSELNAAFAAIAEQRPDALLVGSDPYLLLRREELVALTARLRIPAVYPFREFAAAGGLVSYGTNIANAYRQAGIYAGRISSFVPHPITSSERVCRVGGMSKPSVFAVLRFMTSSNVVGCMTGRSAGIAPFRNPKCLGRSVPDTFSARSAHLAGLKMRGITRAVSLDGNASDPSRVGIGSR